MKIGGVRMLWSTIIVVSFDIGPPFRVVFVHSYLAKDEMPIFELE